MATRVSANRGTNGNREVSGNTIELMPLEGSTSEVWKHFGFPGGMESLSNGQKEAHRCLL